MYTLDWISEVELGIKKFEYKSEGMSLDQFYEKDPINYFKYNIIDVILPKKLNEKLQHINLHNLLRRDMKTPLTMSIRGSSALFDTYISHELEKDKKFTRYGIITETNMSISEKEILNMPLPTQKSVKFNLTKIDDSDYRKHVSRYPGAYVKDSPSDLFVADKKSTIADLDARAMYPSGMLQNNISFDSYFGRVLDPLCYPFMLQFLNKILGTNNSIDDVCKNFHESIFPKVNNYVETRISVQNKNNSKQELYFIIWDKILKLKQANKPLNRLFKPRDRNDLLLMKNYLLPLLDLIVDISDKSEDYNLYAHNYLLNNEFMNECFKYKFNDIYIVQNANNPSINIITLPYNDIYNYLIKNNLSLNISGALFYRHDYKLGLMYKFLEDRLAMRSEYKKLRDTFKVGTEEYKLWDSNQNAMKVNANSAYGLTGMAMFRFSNRYLAKSTTVSGRLTLKIAQIISELYLDTLA